ncbi:MAG: Ig-like domain-containing protein, partial [Bryobacteraceae bacterium]
SAAFSATTAAVGSTQSATITATYNSSSANASISLVAPVLVSSLACAPTSLGPNSSSTCTVTLTQPAPTGGASVTLSNSNTTLTVPASVTVAAAATSAAFSATTAAVGSTQSATITATYNSSSAKAGISLVEVRVSSVTCTPASLEPNATSTCTVTLDKAALTGGAAIQLSSNNPILTVPASVTVADGSTAANFSAMSASIPSNQTATVTADFNSGSHSASIKLVAPALVSLAVTPANSTIAKGATQQFTATGKFSDGSTQNLTTSVSWKSSATKVATVTSTGVATGVAAGNAAIQATSDSISGSTVLTVSASLSPAVTVSGAAMTQGITSTSDPSAGAASKTASTLRDLYCLPRSAKAGDHVSCELRVSGIATPRTLHLTSNSEAVRIPAVVTARSGQSKVTFQVLIDPAARQQTARIAAAEGDTQVEDAISVIPAAGPVLRAPGLQMVKPGETLSFAVSAIDPDSLPLQLSAMGLPEGASFEASTGQFGWTPNPSQAGRHEVAFSAVNSVGVSSTERVGIEVGTGVPVLNEPQKLACSPNAIAIVSGEWLAAGASEPSGSTVELGGAKLKVNEQYVPVLLSSATQVQFVCPALLPGTPLSVVVETALGATKPLIGNMREATPRILALGDTQGTQGVISFADGAELAMPRNADMAGYPAQPGDTVKVWATGLGPDAQSRTTDFSVTMGGVNVPVESIDPVAGHAGLYTVQLRVPVTSGDTVPVQLRVVTPTGLTVWSNTVSAAVETGN